MHKPIVNAAYQTYVLVALNLGVLTIAAFSWTLGNSTYLGPYQSSTTQIWNASHSNVTAALGLGVTTEPSVTTIQYIPNGAVVLVGH